MNDPFPIGEPKGRPYIRPHRLSDTEFDFILERLNRPAKHVSIGDRINLLLLTLLGILGWGLLFVGLYAWLSA